MKMMYFEKIELNLTILAFMILW